MLVALNRFDPSIMVVVIGSSEDDAATLDMGEEFRLIGTQVVEAEVAPVDVKNEVEDTTL